VSSSIPTDKMRGETIKARVLIVDDDRLQLLIHRRKLLNVLPAADIVEARNGAQALEAIQHDGPFDAVLTDLNMPVMDGATFIRQATAGNLFDTDTIVHLLTAQTDERVKSLEGRFATYEKTDHSRCAVKDIATILIERRDIATKAPEQNMVSPFAKDPALEKGATALAVAVSAAGQREDEAASPSGVDINSGTSTPNSADIAAANTPNIVKMAAPDSAGAKSHPCVF